MPLLRVAKLERREYSPGQGILRGVEPPHSPYNPLIKDRRMEDGGTAAVLSRSELPRCPKPSLVLTPAVLMFVAAYTSG